LRPLFVSRAPQRRNSGAAHKDTIYAQPERLKAQGGVTQKVPLVSLALKDIDKLIDPHRNEKLYSRDPRPTRSARRQGRQGLFRPITLHKPDREGNPTGPVVRTVTMVIDKLSGIPVRGGIAKNDTMLRVDVFRHKKDGKFHLVPVYVHHRNCRIGSVQGNCRTGPSWHKDEMNGRSLTMDSNSLSRLHPNDFIENYFEERRHLSGYYAGCNRSTGAFNLWAHDRNQKSEKKGLIESIGVKTAVALEKFHVDVLGNIYPAPQEQRRGLA
jgi:CRISPR-associated endonuclease Csn1